MRRFSRESEHLCALLQCEAPFFQAPMAGGPSTPELAAAVAGAGGVGAVAGAYLSPTRFREDLRKARQVARRRNPTRQCIVGNLFVPARGLDRIDWSHPTNQAWLAAAERNVRECYVRGVVLQTLCRHGRWDDARASLDAAVDMAFRRMAPAQLDQLLDSERQLSQNFTASTSATKGVLSGDAVVAAQSTVQRDFEACCVAALEERPAGMSFVFGAPDAAIIADMRRRGIAVLGTATTVDEAMELRERGFDAVIAQGVEAGGHRGSFEAPLCVDDDGVFSPRAATGRAFVNPEHDPAALTTVGLVRAIRDVLDGETPNAAKARPTNRPPLPIIAAGGIMDADGIVSAMLNGAAGAQLGTAFLLSKEAGTSPAACRALRMHGFSGRARDTVMTRAFSGRWARGVANAVTERHEGMPGAVAVTFPDPATADMSDEAKLAAAVEQQLAQMREQHGVPAEGDGPAKKATGLAADSILPFPLHNDMVAGMKRGVIQAASHASNDAVVAGQCQLGAAEVVNVWAGSNVALLGAYDGSRAGDIAVSLIDQVDSMIGPEVRGV